MSRICQSGMVQVPRQSFSYCQEQLHAAVVIEPSLRLFESIFHFFAVGILDVCSSPRYLTCLLVVNLSCVPGCLHQALKWVWHILTANEIFFLLVPNAGREIGKAELISSSGSQPQRLHGWVICRCEEGFLSVGANPSESFEALFRACCYFHLCDFNAKVNKFVACSLQRETQHVFPSNIKYGK